MPVAARATARNRALDVVRLRPRLLRNRIPRRLPGRAGIALTAVGSKCHQRERLVRANRRVTVGTASSRYEEGGRERGAKVSRLAQGKAPWLMRQERCKKIAMLQGQLPAHYGHGPHCGMRCGAFELRACRPAGRLITGRRFALEGLLADSSLCAGIGRGQPGPIGRSHLRHNLELPPTERLDDQRVAFP